MTSSDIPDEIPPDVGVQGTGSASAAADRDGTQVPVPGAETYAGPMRRLVQPAALSVSARPKFAQQGTFSSLEISVFVTDYYEAGDVAARTALFDELVQWTEDAMDRQAGRFNEWRHAMGHHGDWGLK